MNRFMPIAILLLWAVAPGTALELSSVRLPVSGLQQGDQFGAAVAVGGGIIAVGAYLADTEAGKDAGAVYLFKRGTNGDWIPFGSGRLTRGAGEWFGFDVAIDSSGTTLVVGAPSPGRGPGAAYVYGIDKEREVATFLRSLVARAANGDELGSAVAIDGPWVAVGSRGADQRAGRAYVFPVAGGEPTSLVPSQPVAGAELGQSVSVRGRMLAVGAPLPGRDGKSPGAVYLSRLGSNGAWDELEPLPVPADLEAGAAFGYSVSVVDGEGGDVVVGAPLASSQAGAVYRYPSGERQPFRVGSRGDQVGVAVASGGEWIVAGARGADRRHGAAYLFNSQGDFIQPLDRSSELTPGDEFGFSAATQGKVIVVGAFKKDGKGAAYVFEEVVRPPTLTVSLSPVAPVQEAAGKASVQVTLTNSSPIRTAEEVEITVAAFRDLADLAQPGEDYFEGEQKVKFSTGLLGSKTETVQIPIVNDTVAEDTESFTVKLSAPAQVAVIKSPIQVKILDDDCVDLVLPEFLTLVEGGTVSFTVFLPRQPDSDVTLNFTSPVVEASSVKFKAKRWASGKRVEVSSQGDALCNGNRSFTIDVTAESNDPQFSCIAEPIQGTILDDDVSCPGADATMAVCAEGDGTVVYILVVENIGNVALHGNGPEISAVLPEEVTVVTASADKGVATVDYLENAVAWNGSIPVGATATIQILATLEPDVAPGTDVSFDTTYDYDIDNEPFRDIACPFIAALRSPEQLTRSAAPPAPGAVAAGAPTRAPSAGCGSWRARPWP